MWTRIYFIIVIVFRPKFYENADKKICNLETYFDKVFMRLIKFYTECYMYLWILRMANAVVKFQLV